MCQAFDQQVPPIRAKEDASPVGVHPRLAETGLQQVVFLHPRPQVGEIVEHGQLTQAELGEAATGLQTAQVLDDLALPDAGRPIRMRSGRGSVVMGCPRARDDCPRAAGRKRARSRF